MSRNGDVGLIRIAGIVKESIVDGPGLRYVIFTQGCHHYCEGCHNQHTWDLKGGEPISISALVEKMQAEITELHQGITISGGEPFIWSGPLARFCEQIRRWNPNLDIMVYTGFRFAELNARSHQLFLRYIDILVDGPFIKELADPTLKWRGSSNQRILYLDERRAIAP